MSDRGKPPRTDDRTRTGGRGRPQVVDEPRNRMEAELRRGALEVSGITARLATDDAGGMHPHLGPSTAGLRLVVAADQADEARTILAALDAGDWAIDDDHSV